MSRRPRSKTISTGSTPRSPASTRRPPMLDLAPAAPPALAVVARSTLAAARAGPGDSLLCAARRTGPHGCGATRRAAAAERAAPAAIDPPLRCGSADASRADAADSGESRESASGLCRAPRCRTGPAATAGFEARRIQPREWTDVLESVIDIVVNKVIARMGDDTMRTAVLDAAERLVREEIDRIKNVR